MLIGHALVSDKCGKAAEEKLAVREVPIDSWGKGSRVGFVGGRGWRTLAIRNQVEPLSHRRIGSALQNGLQSGLIPSQMQANLGPGRHHRPSVSVLFLSQHTSELGLVLVWSGPVDPIQEVPGLGCSIQELDIASLSSFIYLERVKETGDSHPKLYLCKDRLSHCLYALFG